MIMKKRIFHGLTLLFALSCTGHHDKLDEALRLAGDNRSQLEQVLDHYAQSPADSLKLRAARFLIENMPGHYTLDGKIINTLRAEIDRDTVLNYLQKKNLDISLCFKSGIASNSRKLEDVQHITAEYLIHHIDRSFERREYFPWLRYLPFDDFLEYVLPYRVANERPDAWIDAIQVDTAIARPMLLADNGRYNTWIFMKSLPLNVDKDIHEDILGPRIIQSDLYQDCFHLALHDLFRSKASAIPAAVDCLPHYANRNGYHYWNASRTPDIKNTNMESSTERKSGKVYRLMFSLQTDWQPAPSEYMPDFFKNPFYRDVTDYYMHTADVSLSMARGLNASPRYAYLAVFCDLDWKTITIAPVKHRQAAFLDMGKDILYRPVYFRRHTMCSLDYPFILGLEGKTHRLVPDTTRLLSLRLERKYPTSAALLMYVQELSPSVLLASNLPLPSSSDTLASSFFALKTRVEVRLDTARPYRYWHVEIPRGVTCAEAIFFDAKGQILKGQIDGQHFRMQDGDPLTNQIPPVSGKNVATIDFGRPVSISRVVLLPRSDGNGIYPGDDYELFYHDLDGWQSLGRRVATDYFLDYDNLPAGALYWLHNHTRGVEERPFTITDSGGVRFW